MANYDLKGAQGDSIFELKCLVRAITVKLPWEGVRDKTREACDHFLTLAAASILADMKPNLFFLNLCRCAENWRRYLLTSRDHFKRQPPITYAAPLFAAIAADDKALIKGVEQVLPNDWLEGEEYEDNFVSAKIFALLASRNLQKDDEIVGLIARLENLEEAPVDSVLFKALLGLEDLTQDDFWSQLDVALVAQEVHVEAKLSSVGTSIDQFIAHRFIWFKGLAWLRMAINKGFTVPTSGIKYCPDEALMKMPEPYQGDWLLVPLPGEQW